MKHLGQHSFLCFAINYIIEWMQVYGNGNEYGSRKVTLWSALTLCHLFCGPLPDRWSIAKPVFGLLDGLSFCWAGVYLVSAPYDRPRAFCFYGLPESRLTSQGSSVKYAHFSSSPGDGRWEIATTTVTKCKRPSAALRFADNAGRSWIVSSNAIKILISV